MTILETTPIHEIIREMRLIFKKIWKAELHSLNIQESKKNCMQSLKIIPIPIYISVSLDYFCSRCQWKLHKISIELKKWSLKLWDMTTKVFFSIDCLIDWYICSTIWLWFRLLLPTRLLLFPWHFRNNIQPLACEATAPTHCTTAATSYHLWEN